MYLFVSRDQRTIDTLKLNGLAYVGKTTGQLRQRLIQVLQYMGLLQCVLGRQQLFQAREKKGCVSESSKAFRHCVTPSHGLTF
jgi:hypothetical protein